MTARPPVALPTRAIGPDASPASQGGRQLSLDTTALGQLMPMCLVINPAGVVQSVGPTLAKLLGGQILGRPLFEVCNARRPYGARSPRDLLRSGGRITLDFNTNCPPLRGLAVGLGDGGYLLNLTLGLSVIDEIEERDLTADDFAPTDLTIELLYLVEAKSAVIREGQNLNARLAEAKRAAEAQALTDTLTGLANRRAMDLALAQLLQIGAGFGLLQLDLDFFKQVNDSLGHAAGDHVLYRVGQSLQASTRPGDTVARTGGDEFLLLLPGTVEPDQLVAVGERLIEGVMQPILWEGQHCHVAASVGATASAFYRRPGADRMLLDADHALYQSKRAGRGKVTIWSDPTASA